MDLWTFRRYHAPELDVDEVNIDRDNNIVSLKKRDHSYILQVDNTETAESLFESLRSLSDKNSADWPRYFNSPIGEGWGAVGEFLDERSLIREDHDGASLALERLEHQLTAIVAATSQYIIDNVPAKRRNDLQKQISALLAYIDSEMKNFTAIDGASIFDPSVETNFFHALLRVEVEYFNQFSPFTLSALRILLSTLQNNDDLQTRDWFDPDEMILCDFADMESHLWVVAHCLIEAVGPQAERLPLSPYTGSTTLPGIEFMRRIELSTRSTLKQWGENPYVTALDMLDGKYSPLIAGPFIEQYHVTRRFVEIVAPLLSKRLMKPLRQMMFQYFGEEYGHEALESTTCEALGVTPAALDMSVPLPGHFAFVDVLTVVAKQDPLASFASIMAIEGVFGEPPKMSLRLAAVARTNPSFSEITDEHEELNEDLNHNSISRNAFEHIEAVSAASQERVMHIIMFLLELNHRAWGGIVDFYGRQENLLLHGPLGCLFDPVQDGDILNMDHRTDLRAELRSKAADTGPLDSSGALLQSSSFQPAKEMCE